MASREPGALKRFLMLRVVPPLGLLFVRAMGRSWRFHETRRELLDRGLASGKPLVGGFLHGRTFQLLYYMSRPGHGRWVLMCSKSLDGEAMARVETALGYHVVRGSSGTGGLEGLVEMVRAVRADPSLGSAMAVDGSRGPRGHAQAGVIALAKRVGGLVLPVAASASPAWIFRNAWDRTVLPMPFARVHVVYGRPIEVPRRIGPEEIEALRLRLETDLLAAQREADALSGFADPEPLQAPAGPV